MIDDRFDCLIRVAEIFLVELFDVLFLDAVDDALHANGGDSLLQVKLLLEPLRFGLEGEEVALTRAVRDIGIYRVRLGEARGVLYHCFRYDFVVRIVEDEGQGSMESAPSGCLDRRDHLGHLFRHFVHGRRGRLSDDYVERLCRHD